MTRNVQCVEIGNLAVPGMRIKVRWFPDGANNGKVWRAPANILSFSRVVGGPILHRDVSKRASSFHPAGPLTFWPHSSVWESRRNCSQVLTVSAYFDSAFAAAADTTKPEEVLIDDFSMLEMMQIIHDEVTMPDLGSHHVVSAIGEILRIKLSRLMSQRARNPSITKSYRSMDVAMLHGLIGATGGRAPTTAELAEQFATNRRSLLRLFKETTGTSPSRFIEQTMVDKAKTLLAASPMTMKQIAYESGYSTASHFSTKFRQLTGLTPSAFRCRTRRGGHIHPLRIEDRSAEHPGGDE